MPNRSQDWLAQAERDLEQAAASREDGRHEWACFAAHQAAEKAVEALHLARGQEAWGHVVAHLLADLPFDVEPELVDKARVLRHWKLEDLPVPAELLVYTRDEWDALLEGGGRFADTLRRDSVWVYP